MNNYKWQRNNINHNKINNMVLILFEQPSSATQQQGPIKYDLPDGSIIFNGDNLDVLKTLPDNSLDSIVTDPPYHLTSINKRFGKENSAPNKFGTDGAFQRASKGFLGKHWDGGDIAFRQDVWKECLRVLKPGGHLLAFSHSRTYHNMAVAIEGSGFEIRDQLMWIYGQGFPKSHNIGNGLGTALKPAHEPIAMARKPLSEKTVAENVIKWGTGAINIDDCRIDYKNENHRSGGFKNGYKGSIEFAGQINFSMRSMDAEEIQERCGTGRFPSNLILSDDGNEAWRKFFYCPKASKKDRDSGLDDRQENKVNDGRIASMDTPFQRGETLRKNTHPTVKPTALMQYLVRLVTPKNGTCTDVFFGSGSTGKACIREGFKFIGIEKEKEYFDIAVKRCESELNQNNSMAA